VRAYNKQFGVYLHFIPQKTGEHTINNLKPSHNIYKHDNRRKNIMRALCPKKT
jgi:hypothetical protein